MTAFQEPAARRAARKLRRALVIVNPEKRSRPDLDKALARLSAGGVEIDEKACDVDPSSLGSLGSAQDDVIIVCGGDGTLHRALPLLLKAKAPLGVLPVGTANDLARTLGIPADPVAAADVVLAGHTRQIDLGEVNGHPYFNVASIGMSVKLARDLTGDAKRRWGKAAYAISAIRSAFSSRPFRARVKADGDVFETRTLQIAIGNGRYYGGGMAVDAEAAIDDRHLHLYSLEMESPWRLLPMLMAFRRGTHGRWASVRTSVGDSFEVTTRRPKSISADGEIITSTPARFRVLAGALRVFAPAAS